MKKNEDFEKRLLTLEEKVFSKKEKETKKENDEFEGKSKILKILKLFNHIQVISTILFLYKIMNCQQVLLIII